MRRELLVCDGDPAPLVAELRALIPTGSSVADGVAAIIAGVRERGDAAVLEYTQRFDTGGAPPQPLQVPGPRIQTAYEALTSDLRGGLAFAIANVQQTAAASVHLDQVVRLPASEITVRETPVDSAAVYVPGGRAPYPSTVIMGVVTAWAAGVTEVAVCSPPGPDGEIDPVVLAACRMAGASAVYRMGGAQAIAALAYGTRTVHPVSVIVGPGNLWVQEAKRQVSGQVGIDSFAGPSDLLVLADGGSHPEPISLDLLAQAEHGAGTLVVGASSSRELLAALAERIDAAADTDAVVRLVALDGSEHQAWRLAQCFAPEHLQLIGPDAEALAPRITHAGCVFVGASAATAFGDYIAGSNHILPTGGAARFASALSARTFRRSFTEVRITDPSHLARSAAPLARAEGFELHARSMEARIRENGSS
ncbi:MAG TPA: histidinol dehydrogenase [Solirubrobacteraceae bacterium]|nr:histidinol dehydrogenase [Solirubrobacteraceae bacterium]